MLKRGVWFLLLLLFVGMVHAQGTIPGVAAPFYDVVQERAATGELQISRVYSGGLWHGTAGTMEFYTFYGNTAEEFMQAKAEIGNKYNPKREEISNGLNACADSCTYGTSCEENCREIFYSQRYKVDQASYTEEADVRREFGARVLRQVLTGERRENALRELGPIYDGFNACMNTCFACEGDCTAHERYSGSYLQNCYYWTCGDKYEEVLLPMVAKYVAEENALAQKTETPKTGSCDYRCEDWAPSDDDCRGESQARECACYCPDGTGQCDAEPETSKWCQRSRLGYFTLGAVPFTFDVGIDSKTGASTLSVLDGRGALVADAVAGKGIGLVSGQQGSFTVAVHATNGDLPAGDYSFTLEGITDVVATSLDVEPDVENQRLLATFTMEPYEGAPAGEREATLIIARDGKNITRVPFGVELQVAAVTVQEDAPASAGAGPGLVVAFVILALFVLVPLAGVVTLGYFLTRAALQYQLNAGAALWSGPNAKAVQAKLIRFFRLKK